MKLSLVSAYENPWQYEIVKEDHAYESLTPHGIISNYSFPDSAEKGANLPWNADIHNVGTDGQIAFGILNAEGNPGNLVITWDTAETIILPGYYFRVYTNGSVPNCFHLITNGSVRFEVGGTYTIKLWGMWYNETDGKWYYDSTEEITKTVNVTVTWPFTWEKNVFNNYLLKAESYEIVAESPTKTITNIDMSVLAGGKLDYTITYLKGNDIPNPTAIIKFNGQDILRKMLNLGEVATGSIDISGLIAETNTIKLGWASTIMFWSQGMFDISITIGFSQEPKFDPNIPFSWEEFFNKYGKWMALGVVGLGFIYMIKKPAMPIIVIGGKQ